LCGVKQESVKTGPEAVGCEAEFECFHCEHGSVICEHNTSLAFEIFWLQFYLNLHGEKSGAFSLVQNFIIY